MPEGDDRFIRAGGLLRALSDIEETITTPGTAIRISRQKGGGI